MMTAPLPIPDPETTQQLKRMVDRYGFVQTHGFLLELAGWKQGKQAFRGYWLHTDLDYTPRTLGAAIDKQAYINMVAPPFVRP
jgi:hypothetical protein